MEIVSVLFRQVIVMFILMTVGYVAYRRRLISDQGTKDLGKILLNIALPVTVLSNFCVERTPEKIMDLASSLFISVLVLLTAILIARLFFHNKDRVAEFSASFCNAGFVGIPLVQATFGSGAVFYISMMVVLVNVLQWTHGIYTLTDDLSSMKPRAILKNPVILAVVIGLILFFGGISLPSIITDVFGIINGLNTPLAMLASGVYLAQSDLIQMLRKKAVYEVCLFRLILIPLVTILLIRLIPFGSETLKLAILCTACGPVGSNVSIFAEQYGCDYRSAVEQVCISTILSILTLPLMMLVATALIS